MTPRRTRFVWRALLALALALAAALALAQLGGCTDAQQRANAHLATIRGHATASHDAAERIKTALDAAPPDIDGAREDADRISAWQLSILDVVDLVHLELSELEPRVGFGWKVAALGFTALIVVGSVAGLVLLVKSSERLRAMLGAAWKVIVP